MRILTTLFFLTLYSASAYAQYGGVTPPSPPVGIRTDPPQTPQLPMSTPSNANNQDQGGSTAVQNQATGTILVLPGSSINPGAIGVPKGTYNPPVPTNNNDIDGPSFPPK